MSGLRIRQGDSSGRQRARVGAERASAYPEHFRGVVLPKLRALDGFVTATMLSRRVDEHVEFVVLTRWTSLESIRGFAGQDIGKAVVEPAARATLSSFDLTVQHYTDYELCTDLQ